MIKEWHVQRKKYTDGLAKKRWYAKQNDTKDAPITVAVKKYTGVIVESLRMM